jgi:hypothetical protein
MMTLLRALHSIAARRGDGLRPEFLQMTTQSPPWPEIEKMAADGDPAETEESCASEVPENAPIAEILPLPVRKR